MSPLVKVNNGLRSFLGTLRIKAEVSQRLKRMETIVEKITERESGLSLDRMVDIGGCRVVLEDDDIDKLYRIADRIKDTWKEDLQKQRERDYIKEPRESGYRAIHLVVKRDERLIEIQLRTARMHKWAQTMEGLSQAFGINFKQDRGRHSVQELGKVLSKAHQQLDGMYVLTDEDRRALTFWTNEVNTRLSSLSSGGGA